MPMIENHVLEATVSEPVAPIPPQFTNLDKRRQVLDWRDQHMASVEPRLQELIETLFDSVRKLCREMSKEDLAKVGVHYQKHIQPMCDVWISTTGQRLIEAAIKDLPVTVTTSGTPAPVDGILSRSEDVSINTDSRSAKAAIGLGIAAAPITASMATVSAGGIAGLLGATVIAWPVVAAGALVGGGLLLFGGKSLANKREREISEYESKVLGLIHRIVFDRSEERKSLVLILEQSIDDIAERTLKEAKW